MEVDMEDNKGRTEKASSSSKSVTTEDRENSMGHNGQAPPIRGRGNSKAKSRNSRRGGRGKR